MKNRHVFLLVVILFSAGTVSGAYVQYHRDIRKQLRPFIPGASNQRYEVYAC
jgi:hypothetical protein